MSEIEYVRQTAYFIGSGFALASCILFMSFYIAKLATLGYLSGKALFDRHNQRKGQK